MPDNENAIPQRLQTLEDQEAIRTLKHRYAEAVDRCVDAPSAENAAVIADMFTDDADVDFSPIAKVKGRSQILNLYQNVIPSILLWSQHYMTNPIIEVNGSSAAGRWYTLFPAVNRSTPAAPPAFRFVRYEDTYVKTESGWKFQSVTAIFRSPPAPPA